MYYAVVCTRCEKPHFDITNDNFLFIENTQAGKHGGWESGEGETIEAAKADALAAVKWALDIVPEARDVIPYARKC